MAYVDYEFSRLCETIDYWRDEANKWKEEYNKLLQEYSEYLDSSLKSSQECAGNILKLLIADSTGEVLHKAFGKSED
jgi:hypothetical protein